MISKTAPSRPIELGTAKLGNAGGCGNRQCRDGCDGKCRRDRESAHPESDLVVETALAAKKLKV